MQDGHPIALKSKKLSGAQLQWLTHEKELYIVVCCVKTWQHYLGMHKTKVFTNNVSLRYFETQLVTTLALGSQPRQRGYKVVSQEEARESRQRGRKGAGQDETRESHHILQGV